MAAALEKFGHGSIYHTAEELAEAVADIGMDDPNLIWRDGYREGWNAAMTQGIPPWKVKAPYA